METKPPPQPIDERLKIYVERLFKEWQAYGKIVIGVDYDSTISPYGTFGNKSDIERTINVLKECVREGCFIVINTSCNADRFNEILDYCKSINLGIDTINATPPGLNIQFGQRGSKPYCNHYLDDRSGLPTALDILEMALYTLRTEKNAVFSKDGVA